MDLIQFDNFHRHHLQLFTPDEAINLGNLFKDLYMSYKGFSNYCFNAMNEREKLLYEVQKYCFCAHEMNLYLDNYGHNCDVYNLYKDYKNKADQYMELYENQYGPLTVEHSNCKNNFNWIKGPWPWERH